MKLVSHGGGCCGMSHIYGLGSDPNYMQVEIKEMTPEEQVEARKKGYIQANEYYCPRPKETTEERLKAFIAEVTKNRSKGIIEVVVTNKQLSPNIKELCMCSSCVSWRAKKEEIKKKNELLPEPKLWGEVLAELGFKEVNVAINSNSSNELHVFHLNTNQA